MEASPVLHEGTLYYGACVVDNEALLIFGWKAASRTMSTNAGKAYAARLCEEFRQDVQDGSVPRREILSVDSYVPVAPTSQFEDVMRNAETGDAGSMVRSTPSAGIYINLHFVTYGRASLIGPFPSIADAREWYSTTPEQQSFRSEFVAVLYFELFDAEIGIKEQNILRALVGRGNLLEHPIFCRTCFPNHQDRLTEGVMVPGTSVRGYVAVQIAGPPDKGLCYIVGIFPTETAAATWCRLHNEQEPAIARADGSTLHAQVEPVYAGLSTLEEGIDVPEILREVPSPQTEDAAILVLAQGNGSVPLLLLGPTDGATEELWEAMHWVKQLGCSLIDNVCFDPDEILSLRQLNASAPS